MRGALVLAVLLVMLPLCLARVHAAATASSLGTAFSFGNNWVLRSYYHYLRDCSR
jgi:hypothetical protein